MAQLEYGDYYKFVASAGIALLVAAVLLPWLFLREPFDLAIEGSKIALLTPDAQNVLRERQHLIAAIITLIPFASVGLGLAGLAVTGFGLFRWHERQSIRDRGEDLGVQKLTKELEQMSPEEVKAKAQIEIESTEEAPQVVANGESSAPVNRLLAVEAAVVQRFSECLGPSLKVMYNQRLGDVEYDAIIRLKPNRRVILEIKYIQRGFRHGWLTESINNLAAKTTLYSNTFSRNATGVLLIVLAAGAQPLTRRVTDFSQQLRTSQPARFSNLRIHAIDEAVISTISCNQLKAILD